jgi:hypothetical protein
MSITKLQKIQMGVETTSGTAVPATTIWRGKGAFEDLTEVQFVDERVGYLPPVKRSYIASVAGQLSLEEIEATFEQLPYLLEAGVQSVTATADTGSGYIYSYVFPTTAVNTIKTYTIEHGDDQQAEEMAYCFVSDFRLTGAYKEALKMEATFVGRQLGTSTFTTSLALPVVEEILFQKATLYIDDEDGTIGGTPVACTLISAALDANTGLKPYFCASGQLYFHSEESIGPEVSLDLRLKHNASAVAEKADWRSETARQVRLKFEGSALQTAGVYTYKTLIVDLAGTWKTFSALEDDDGNTVVTGSLRGEYNPTAALFCEVLVVNELTALP